MFIDFLLLLLSLLFCSSVGGFDSGSAGFVLPLWAAAGGRGKLPGQPGFVLGMEPVVFIPAVPPKPGQGGRGEDRRCFPHRCWARPAIPSARRIPAAHSPMPGCPHSYSKNPPPKAPPSLPVLPLSSTQRLPAPRAASSIGPLIPGELCGTRGTPAGHPSVGINPFPLPNVFFGTEPK